MNDLSTDDPQLTAYALGELTNPAERMRIDAFLQDSPAARAEVEEIRALSARLTAEYEQDRLSQLASTNIVALPHQHRRSVATNIFLPIAASIVAVGIIAGFSLPIIKSVSFRDADSHKFAGNIGSASRSRVDKDSVPLLPRNAPTPAATAIPGEKLALAKSGASVHTPNISGSESRGEVVPGSALLAAIPNARRGPISQSGAVYGWVAAAPSALSSPAGPGLQRSKEISANAIDRLTSPADHYDRLVEESVALNRDYQVQARDAVPVDIATWQLKPENADAAAYEHRPESVFVSAKESPLSTFGVDVDTASYSNVRRFIEQGSLPPPDAVRIEEMLNYFPYSDAPPAADNPRPFAIHLEAAACPWAPEHRLVRIALKGREMAADKRPASNLVFLIDVSGSMTAPERLPLIKESLRQMVEKLGDNDRVGIVVYAGESGVALPSTTGDHKDVILGALGGLHPGGSTNGSAGITLAYQIVQEHFIKGGVNRVILATDGDFNVGVTSRADLVRQIEAEAKGGVFLSVLGVGIDNLKDSTMQMLADHGNGNYAYLDSLAEGRKVLVEQMSGTLVTIAKDVKIQVEFNPAAVSAYRLIGYEKRALRPEDFNNDKIDAGEIGAGHSVIALYEVAPAGQPVPGAAPTVDPLKYQGEQAAPPAVLPKPASPELLTVKVRHKAPDGDHSERSYEEPLIDHGAPGDYANASIDWKFSAAVASFGQLLRGSAYQGSGSFDSAIELAQEGKGADASGYRAGFIELARRAQALERGSQR